MQKKILHIAFVGGGGGVDIAIKLINKHLDTELFEQIIISNEITNKYLNGNNKEIQCFTIHVNRQIALKRDIQSLIKLIKLIKQIKPDIIHCHSAKAGVLGRISGKILGIPTFYTPHAFSYLSAQSKIKYHTFLLFEKTMKILANKAKIIACSASEKKRAINDVGYKIHDVVVYKNSIENPRLFLKPKNKKLDYACAIGRPSYQKNIEFLIIACTDIVKIIPDFKLFILGVGFHSPNLDRVKSLIKLNRLDNNVELLEWIDRTEALNILNNARLYLSSSRYEGLALSGIEAISLGIPTVCTAVDGNVDAVINNKTGYLIKNFDRNDFAAKTIDLMTNEKLRETFAENAKIYFDEAFNINDNIKILESIYSNIN